MGQITVEHYVAEIDGLCVFTPTVHGDSRGCFYESCNANDTKEAGLDITFVQDNQSMSTKGVLRGFVHGFRFLPDTAEFCYKCDDFYHPNDEGGMAWNDPEIVIVCPKLEGKYNGTSSAEGYCVDGVQLKLSDTDQNWLGIKDTFKFEV